MARPIVKKRYFSEVVGGVFPKLIGILLLAVDGMTVGFGVGSYRTAKEIY